MYADEDIGVREPQLESASLPIRECEFTLLVLSLDVHLSTDASLPLLVGKIGGDMVNAVCTSLLPLHQLAKNSPKLQGHLKNDLGLLDNG